MKSFEQIARAMYAAYCESLPDIGFSKPGWETLSAYMQGAWIAAAKRAHKEISEVH